MIACFTPLPPSPSGVADFALDLLRPLQQRTGVKIFVEDTRSQLALPEWPVYSSKRFAPGKFECALYQLGNNVMHRFAYDAALKYPGVIVLHDALLQHMLLGESWDAWEREFVFTYGEQGREIAANLRNGNPATHEGFFRFPLTARVVKASRGVIVTNEGARDRVLREAPDADVRVIPLPFVARGQFSTKAAARMELGIPTNAFLIGCFGYMRESRLLQDVLGVVEDIRAFVPRAQFAMVGTFTTPEQESFLAGRLRAMGGFTPGHVSDAEFEQWGMACDVIVNLRHPSAGEMSGVAVRMMGLGIPVILTDSPENADFPDDACLKVPHDEREAALLVEFLLALARSPELGQVIGMNARDYIRREHHIERVVDSYLAVLALHSAHGQISLR